MKIKFFKSTDTKSDRSHWYCLKYAPDIAIIQGPPGTGKTTVLTAVIERLNEESDKENIKGQILVAGL